MTAHRQHHRGPHPDDARLFAPAQLPRLRAAAHEVEWLLGRGYPIALALVTVGNHHQLETRQRLALQRACCAADLRAARRARAWEPPRVAGAELRIDGFNLLVTLEVALGGGLLVEGSDGTLRDLAGMRGSYHPVDETDAALDLVGRAFAALGPARAAWYLDAAVSNSGRLRARILEHGARWTCPVQVDLVPDPDPVLSVGDGVVSADAAILDACAGWVNLAAWVVTAHVPGAWRLRLFGEDGGPAARELHLGE